MAQTRRTFLLSSLAVPLIGAETSEPITPDGYEAAQYRQYPPPPLTDHLAAVQRIVQDNMNWATAEPNGYVPSDVAAALAAHGKSLKYPTQQLANLRISRAVGTKAKPVLDWLINDVFPEQWRQMATIRLAGIQPMTGPTSLLFVDSGEPVKMSLEGVVLPSFGPTALESMMDYKALHGGLVKQYPGLEQPRSVTVYLNPPSMLRSSHLGGYAFTSYQPINGGAPLQFFTNRLDKVAVIACSKPLDSPDSLAAAVDRQFFRTALWMAEPATFDVHEKIGPGAWVASHPDDAEKVRRRLGEVPVVTERCPVGTVLMGFKRSEYDASAFFMPYHGYYVSPDSGTLVTRFGMSFPSEFMKPLIDQSEINLNKITVKPVFWKLEV